MQLVLWKEQLLIKSVVYDKGNLCSYICIIVKPKYAILKIFMQSTCVLS